MHARIEDRSKGLNLFDIIQLYYNLKNTPNPGAAITQAITHLEEQIKTAITNIKVEPK